MSRFPGITMADEADEALRLRRASKALRALTDAVRDEPFLHFRELDEDSRNALGDVPIGEIYHAILTGIVEAMG